MSINLFDTIVIISTRPKSWCLFCQSRVFLTKLYNFPFPSASNLKSWARQHTDISHTRDLSNAAFPVCWWSYLRHLLLLQRVVFFLPCGQCFCSAVDIELARYLQFSMTIVVCAVEFVFLWFPRDLISDFSQGLCSFKDIELTQVVSKRNGFKVVCFGEISSQLQFYNFSSSVFLPHVIMTKMLNGIAEKITSKTLLHWFDRIYSPVFAFRFYLLIWNIKRFLLVGLVARYINITLLTDETRDDETQDDETRERPVSETAGPCLS